jgi:hypothetical protein
MPLARLLVAVTLATTALAGTAASPDTLGAGVTLKDVTPIADLLEKPAEYEGRTVRVEGVVKAVCTHMGCWMALAPADAPDGPTVRFKVEDGVIVFPVSAKGRRAAAQGVVERIAATDAESKEAAAEHARAEGGTPRAQSASWQVRATGAVVY